MTRRTPVSTIGAVAALALITSSASAQPYIVHGGLSDSDRTWLTRINTRHEIVGGGNGVEQPNYAVALNFPVAPPPMYGYYSNLNNRSDIVGQRDFTFFDPFPQVSQAVAVIDGQRIQIQPTTLAESNAYAINESRVVLGSGGVTGGSWLWNADNNQFRAVLAPDNAAPTSATNLNNATQVTGVRNGRGFIWDPDAGSTWITRPAGVEADLKPGRINALGMLPLSGPADAGPGGQGIAGVVMPGGSFVNFSMLTGGDTSIMQLNDVGVVIGDSAKIGPFIWDADHGMRALRSLMPPPVIDGNLTKGYSLLGVVSISDDGWILARGQSYTRSPFFDHTFPMWMMLEPTPAPGALPLLGLAALTRRRFR